MDCVDAGEALNSLSWQNSAGVMLSEMMEMAGYHFQSQRSHFDFFARYVAPALGSHPEVDRKPPPWRSFMTDDGSPIELSWSWSVKESAPIVRYSIEPIGNRAGLSPDCFNTHTGDELVHTIQRSYWGVDLTGYAHFFKELVVCGEGTFAQTITKEDGSNSQIFLAFDLLDEKIMLKVYFLPTLRAIETGQCKLAMVEKAISTLSPHGQSLSGAFSLVCEYIRSLKVGNRPEIEILAVDCVNPALARVKVYLRSRETSFGSVVSMMTLGGRLKELSKEGFASLEELWRLVLSLDPTISSSEPLHLNKRRTAGVLYYFELQPSRSYPKPKVYIPVKHYGKNDLEVANGLSTYLKSKGKRLNDMDYRDALQRLWYFEMRSVIGFETDLRQASIACSIRAQGSIPMSHARLRTHPWPSPHTSTLKSIIDPGPQTWHQHLVKRRT